MTDHPTAEWTIQQFRNGVPPDVPYRYVIHDRDAVFALAVDDALRSMSLRGCGRRRARPARMPIVNASSAPSGASVSIGSFRCTSGTFVTR